MYPQKLIDAAQHPGHPSQNGFLPVILLHPRPSSASLSIGDFAWWAKPNGSDFVYPIERMIHYNAGLYFGGFNQKQPNVGAISVDPEQLKSFHERSITLPAPIVVTAEGDWDSAPLAASHLAHQMWHDILFREPDFVSISNEGTEYHNWVVSRRTPDRQTIMRLIVTVWKNNLQPNMLRVFGEELLRLHGAAVAIRQKGLAGRSNSTLSHELYYQI